MIVFNTTIYFGPLQGEAFTPADATLVAADSIAGSARVVALGSISITVRLQCSDDGSNWDAGSVILEGPLDFGMHYLYGSLTTIPAAKFGRLYVLVEEGTAEATLTVCGRAERADNG